MDDVALIESLASMLETGEKNYQFDNGGLDFSQLESYICPNNVGCFRNLPESPPYSGSEPPFSPEGSTNYNVTSPSLDSVSDNSNQSRSTATSLSLFAEEPRQLHLAAHSYQTFGDSAPAESGLSSSVGGECWTLPPPVPHVHHNRQEGTDRPTCKRPRASSPGRIAARNNSQLDTILEHGSAASVSGAESTSGQKSVQFSAFQKDSWRETFDQNGSLIPSPHLSVEADKGFVHSSTDEAFICQKKNHFQVTCNVQVQGTVHYVKTPGGHAIVDEFRLNFFGVKSENPNHVIIIEQSQSDRSKRVYDPIRLEMPAYQLTKTTVGRMHFSETTSNNMRKKGRPNPEQRYFALVVSVEARACGQWFPLVQCASDKLIVRASNPGQFDYDTETGWLRGVTADALVHTGKVGVNVEVPEEALHVHGNMRLTGHLYNPSDMRIKSNISELDTKQQLNNVQKLRVVKYDYDQKFAASAGLRDVTDTGVIAQEVRHVLPDAVVPAGDLHLPDGKIIDNLLVVNKERIFMENLGAVKELCKVTDTLETRIQGLERVNRRLVKLKRTDSILSSSSISTIASLTSSFLSHVKNRRPKSTPLFAKKSCQRCIVTLITILIVSFVVMTTLYVFENRLRLRLSSNLTSYLGDSNLSSDALSVKPLQQPNTQPLVSGGAHSTVSILNPLHFQRENVVQAILAQGTAKNRANASAMPSGANAASITKQTSTTPAAAAGSNLSNKSPRDDEELLASDESNDSSLTDHLIGYSHTDVSAYAVSFEPPDEPTNVSIVIGGGRLCSATESLASVLSNICQTYCCDESNGVYRPINQPIIGFGLSDGVQEMKEDSLSHRVFSFLNFNRQNNDKVLQTSEAVNMGHRKGTFHGAILLDSNSHHDESDGKIQNWPVVNHPLPGVEYVENISFVEYPDLVVDSRFCERSAHNYRDCVKGVGGNITLRFALSKHMTKEELHLRMQYADRLELAGRPIHCVHSARQELACGQKALLPPPPPPTPPGPMTKQTVRVEISSESPQGDQVPAYVLRMDVGRWLRSQYTFRITLVHHDKTSPCSFPEKYIQSHFIELNLIFERVCDE